MKIAKEILILAVGFLLAYSVLSMFAGTYSVAAESTKPIIITIGAVIVTAYVAYLRKTRKPA